MKRTIFVLFTFIFLTAFGLNSQVSYAYGGQPKYAAQDSVDNNFYFFDSDSRYLTYDEVYELDLWELRIARNEIYALHGRIFSSKDLADYFNSTEWYEGIIPANRFDERVLNKYETANIKLIKEVEKVKSKSKKIRR